MYTYGTVPVPCAARLHKIMYACMYTVNTKADETVKFRWLLFYRCLVHVSNQVRRAETRLHSVLL